MAADDADDGPVQALRDVARVDGQEARRLLAAHGGSLEAAMNEALAESGVAAEGGIRRRRGSDDGGQGQAQGRAAPADDDAATERERRRAHADGQALAFPWNVVALLGSFLVAPLRALTGVNGDVDKLTATQHFLDQWEALTSSGGEDAPRVQFAATSFREAMAEAARTDKLLMVYLHSNQHPDTRGFCTDVLGTDEVCALVNEQMVAWGGAIEYEDAYALSVKMHAGAYPFVAILQPPADERGIKPTLLDRVEGQLEFGSLLGKLKRATEQHGYVLAERAATRFEAQERQRLREEQDLALQQAMEEDRRRDEERERAEREAREREQAEEARRAAEEAEAQKQAAEARDAVERKRQLVPSEPENVKGQVTAIRFQLPTGARFQRRFAPDNSLEQVRAFVDCELHDLGSEISNYAMVLNFPKKTFGPEDDQTRTLAECDLVPQAVLFIQDLDS